MKAYVWRPPPHSAHTPHLPTRHNKTDNKSKKQAGRPIASTLSGVTAPSLAMCAARLTC